MRRERIDDTGMAGVLVGTLPLSCRTTVRSLILHSPHTYQATRLTLVSSIKSLKGRRHARTTNLSSKTASCYLQSSLSSVKTRFQQPELAGHYSSSSTFATFRESERMN